MPDNVERRFETDIHTLMKKGGNGERFLYMPWSRMREWVYNPFSLILGARWGRLVIFAPRSL